MDTYYQIANSDGKIWIMPDMNMDIGMLLYQPSGWKGKILKKYFPYFCRFEIVRDVLHVRKCECPVDDKLACLLKQIFNSDKLGYSWFGGTPNKHQKITIQIFKGEQILGYCKLTSSIGIQKLFEYEQNYLNWLKSKGIEHIPSCLYCGEIEYGKYIFIQSTEKSLYSKVNHELGEKELHFLTDFENKTLCCIPYIDSEQYKSVERLKSYMHLFNTENRISMDVLIKKVEEYYSSKTTYTFAAYHSDFTPWNMIVENNRLFVFDFEYAKYSFMPYLDIFHYIFQTAMFEKKRNAVKIYQYILKVQKKYTEYFDDYFISLALYLIDVVGFYMERDCGEIDQQQKIRLAVIRLLAKNINK